VTGVTYKRLDADNGVLDSVVFATDHVTDLTGVTATMTLNLGGAGITNHTCLLEGTAPTQTYTCEGDGVLLNAFDTVGLTVGGA
jgi:hypothetical protein